MPKFLYTVIIAAVIMWAIMLKFMDTFEPNGAAAISVFELLLLITLTITFSVPVFVVLYKHAPMHTNLRPLFRKSLKWSVFFASGVALAVLLKITDVLTYLNLILLTLLYFVLFRKLVSKRHH
ncbi:hypothetical protein A3F07_00040 [candidate division WWE3 bacterium RIFCSPHIGHO2_12_FULL_38_15]|uniref:Uncharacterized protein n=1 Tax=candidate division WWE3 bacterium RIFCSPHIGHO2_02_FULL_38_14 TaxID=1802620 RepID=A0A1F4V8A8_UNCKA|nr:MAG: hypothetical protein A2793_01160 [candidate division WWE3 bacterium RIFCSPHIGHO2_01_FULL_38_45]OGC49228.1 MAG: hypothetical protein A3F07_00040 [candidate division WWE3 bacterium RIFCSPHIGHO2_12_FULL_38_15]OGC52853.1 MAG: hypothetical protein A3D91_00515 [candidate division WWE3 bacterium RIFCSPHIGHO2_02_FULL_38_14]OGC54123.1 MAG: hypothetical protein A3B64_00305 [candidate division WWE3 bacterium RIFCSPLOWO2_01_FULL_37_24]HLB51318.1 hypothetical protein [Patescibacteria group bacterium